MICKKDYRNNATKIIDNFGSINSAIPVMVRDLTIFRIALRIFP